METIGPRKYGHTVCENRFSWIQSENYQLDICDFKVKF